MIKNFFFGYTISKKMAVSYRITYSETMVKKTYLENFGVFASGSVLVSVRFTWGF